MYSNYAHFQEKINSETQEQLYKIISSVWNTNFCWVAANDGYWIRIEDVRIHTGGEEGEEMWSLAQLFILLYVSFNFFWLLGKENYEFSASMAPFLAVGSRFLWIETWVDLLVNSKSRTYSFQSVISITSPFAPIVEISDKRAKAWRICSNRDNSNLHDPFWRKIKKTWSVSDVKYRYSCWNVNAQCSSRFVRQNDGSTFRVQWLFISK